MKLKDFSFELPAERIARFPADKRENSRLMVVDRKTGTISHSHFRELKRWLDPRDFLVINNSRVVPAKLFGSIEGRTVEMLLTERLSDREAEAFALPARRFRKGVRVDFDNGCMAEVTDTGVRGRRSLKFNCPIENVLKSGFAPLPPYIKRKEEEAKKFRTYDLARYQTVYAGEGESIAAPTAGLHFSEEMMKLLSASHEIVKIRLNVGMATFQKIEVENIENHRMGRETIQISREAADEICRLKKNHHLVAVGTTSVRSLETYAKIKPSGEMFHSELFIYPGFNFQMVDKMITNFHLPESSLFILVSAFAGLDLMKRAYREAVQEGYRFFSYGDAMLIR